MKFCSVVFLVLVACGGGEGPDPWAPDAEAPVSDVTIRRPVPLVASPDALEPDASPAVGSGGAPGATGGVSGTGGTSSATGGMPGAGGMGGAPVVEFPAKTMAAFQAWTVSGCGTSKTIQEVERDVLGPKCASCHKPSNPGIGSFVYSETHSWALGLVNQVPKRVCTVDEPTARILDPYASHQSVLVRVNQEDPQCPYGHKVPYHPSADSNTQICLRSYALSVAQAYRGLGLE